MYQYSGWLFVWTLFYYCKLVNIPPLRIAIIFALLFSSFLLIHYKVPLHYIIFSGIIHSLPLLVLPDKRDYETTKVNLLIFVVYLLYAVNNRIDIINNYKQSALFYQKNPKIFDALKRFII
jgi:hypothetical protein|tara:strand:+ start:785 stop:1147 length:363 start_codon:yes stop_codon:yes gene_type:complete